MGRDKAFQPSGAAGISGSDRNGIVVVITIAVIAKVTWRAANFRRRNVSRVGTGLV